MPALQRWRTLARRLRHEVVALCLACRDPRVPWPARLLAAGLVAYALSPIDLIPDVIPVLGYLDDLVILSLGVLLVRRLIPPAVMVECRARAETLADRPVSRLGAVLVVAVWLGLLILAAWLIWP